MRGQEKGGQRAAPHPYTLAPPKLSPQQGGGGLGENPSDLSPEREFDPWYNEVSRGTFDFKKEASLYCKNDVDILTQGSLKFRDQFLGHPVIIYKDFEDPRSYYGFIRATVYPPRGLLFPVLPHKSEGGKLLFTLCRTCAETNNEGGPCEHDDEGRALTGVWVTVEFIKALESIRDVAEDDLDARMRAILNEQGLSSHEKIKKYNALLQRYLTFVKQDQTENLTENLTKTEAEADSGTDVRTSDSIIDDVLQSLPPREIARTPNTS
ncbi:hypothetical protein D4764_07G0011880 [Takifugu flavidus]|uniref:Uncharacterized protein n=1 Tax=Takifugu flavidus TaxID=433684 RepID=A0A5C6MUL2_9TELE|nr:hypothetical protein D4764_07G0011880 [Takifugu flavidus]